MKVSPHSAFSLVEVTLSLGVISFALLSLLGLFAVGFGGMEESMGRSAKAEIAGKLIADAQLSRFDELPPVYDDRYFYFDELGNPQGAEAIFTAHTKLTPPSSLIGSPEMAGNCWTLVVEVTQRTSPQSAHVASRIIVRQ